MSRHRKPYVRLGPADSALHKQWLSVRARGYATIRKYAEALIVLVRERDADGRDIGFDYKAIRDDILRKFPTVTRNGPHKGRPTKMTYKELQEFACELNREGVRLPFRPRRKAKKESRT
jgi:hypothetical protein